MNKIRLIDGTTTAEYVDDFLYFNMREVSHYIVFTNRRAFTDAKFPNTVDISFRNGKTVSVLEKDFIALQEVKSE